MGNIFIADKEVQLAEISKQIKLKEIEKEIAQIVKEKEIAHALINKEKEIAQISKDVQLANIRLEETKILNARNITRVSKNFASSIYVVAVYDSSHKDFVMSGNCFAIDTNKVVTCFHNIYDNLQENVDVKEGKENKEDESNGVQTNLNIYHESIIFQRATKDDTLHNVFYDPILVKLYEFDEKNDWAILGVVTGQSTFNNLKVQKYPKAFDKLDICRMNEFPIETVDELKVHYYDIKLYNSDEVVDGKLPCVRGQYASVTEYNEKSKVFRVQNGLSTGCCGAPYFDKDNRVVAMHIASLNTTCKREKISRSQDLAKSLKRKINYEEIVKEIDVNSNEISALSYEVSEFTENYTAYKEGYALGADLKFCKCFSLLNSFK